MSTNEPGPRKDYYVQRSVMIGDTGSIVTGRMTIRASRYAEDGKVIHQLVTRDFTGSFSAVREPDPKPPVMTEAQQMDILERAIDGFVKTWVGAINGDGDQSETQSVASARDYLLSRWDAALTIDSLTTSVDHLYLRLRGRYYPIACTITEQQAATRCERVRR